MVFFINNGVVTCRPLCCGLQIGVWGVAKMVGKLGKPYWRILGWSVFGDVLKKVAEVERMIFIVFSFIPEKG
jgi:hypothetical protein